MSQAQPFLEMRSGRVLLGKDRLAAFTDGVFAIAITLLALNVTVPRLNPSEGAREFVQALVGQWPEYAAYAVTFFLVGAYWMNHHRMFHLLAGVNHPFLLLNLFFLMAIAIIPFPNALLADHLLDPAFRSVAATVYGVAMMGLAITFNLVWWYAGWRNRLIKPSYDSRLVMKILKSYLVGPIAYGIAAALAPFFPMISIALFVLIPIGYFFEGPVKGLWFDTPSETASRNS